MITKTYILIEKYRAKKCIKCGEIHPATLEYFQKDKKSLFGLRAVCKKCCNKNTINRYVLLEKLIVKKCSKCGNCYPATIDFFQRSNGKYKTYSQCKNCTNKREKVSVDNKEFYELFYIKQNEVIIKTEKQCTICKNTYPITKEFFYFTNNKFMPHCIECNKKRGSDWNKNNPEKAKESRKTYRKNNIDKTLEYGKKYRQNHQEDIVQYRKDYRKEPENIEKINTYQRKYSKEKRAIDPLYKLRMTIRHSIKESIKKKKFLKKGRTLDILGCTYEEFKTYIENQFLSWMNWNNQGLYDKNKFEYGWDFDHIIPVSSAKTEEEIIKLNHYTNFQPLCSKINRDIKRNKLNFELEFQGN